MTTPDYLWNFSGGDFRPAIGSPTAKFEGNAITHIQPSDYSVIPDVIDVVQGPMDRGPVMRSRAIGTHAETGGAIRSEMQGPPAAPAGEYWYLVEFYIPTDFTADDRQWSLFQLHDQSDGGDPVKYVNGLCVLKGDSLIFTGSGAAPTENQTGRYFCVIDAKRGEWQTWVIQAVWSQTATGLYRGWRDDELLFSVVGANAYPDAAGPYIKAGVYDENHIGGTFDKTAYYAQIGVWSGANTYSSIAGRTEKPPKQRFVL